VISSSTYDGIFLYSLRPLLIHVSHDLVVDGEAQGAHSLAEDVVLVAALEDDLSDPLAGALGQLDEFFGRGAAGELKQLIDRTMQALCRVSPGLSGCSAWIFLRRRRLSWS
jgi:hypothetical protein